MLFAYRQGENRVTAKALRKLRAAEVDLGIAAPESGEHVVPAVGEHSGGYENPASSRERPTASRGERMQLQPKFAVPAPTPDRERCLKHLEQYLMRAETVEGGLGYAWVKLQKHFPLDEFETEETKK